MANEWFEVDSDGTRKMADFKIKRLREQGYKAKKVVRMATPILRDGSRGKKVKHYWVYAKATKESGPGYGWG